MRLEDELARALNKAMGRPPGPVRLDSDHVEVAAVTVQGLSHGAWEGLLFLARYIEVLEDRVAQLETASARQVADTEL